jgi:hypothetical protein
MGSQGLTDSYQNLLNHQLTPFGHPRGWEKETVAFKKINGLSFAFVGLNDVDFKLKKPEILKEISRLALDGHHVIPFLHWGVEYQHQPQKVRLNSPIISLMPGRLWLSELIRTWYKVLRYTATNRYFILWAIPFLISIFPKKHRKV